MITMCFKIFSFIVSYIVGKLTSILLEKFPQVKYNVDKLLSNNLETKLNLVLERLDKAEKKILEMDKEIQRLRGGTPFSEIDGDFKYGDSNDENESQAPIPKPRLSLKDSKIPPPPPLPDFPLFFTNIRTPMWTPTVTPIPTPRQNTPEPEMNSLTSSSLKQINLPSKPQRQKPSTGELLKKRGQLKTARSPGGTPLSQRLQGTTKDFLQSRVSHRIPTTIEEELRRILKDRRPPSPERDSSFEQDFSFN